MGRSVKTLFLLKKDKAAFRRIMHWLSIGGKPSEISLAKSISSVITHILIEMEGASDREDSISIAYAYKLHDWVDMLNKLTSAEMDVGKAFSCIEGMMQ